MKVVTKRRFPVVCRSGPAGSFSKQGLFQINSRVGITVSYSRQMMQEKFVLNNNICPSLLVSAALWDRIPIDIYVLEIFLIPITSYVSRASQT